MRRGRRRRSRKGAGLLRRKKSPFLGGFRKETPLLFLVPLFVRVSLASSISGRPVPLPPYLNLTFVAVYLYYGTTPWQVQAV